MRRRDVLGALAASGALSASGCVTSGSLLSSGPSHAEEVAIVEQDSVPRDVEFDIRAEVTNGTYSDERPAEIEVVVENTGERKRISIYNFDETLDCHLLNRYHAGPKNTKGLWLNTPDRAEHLSRNGNRWEQDRPQDDTRMWAAYGCGNAPYESGDTFTQTYQVWHDFRVDGYLNPGTYRWEQQVGVVYADQSDTVFRWGFTLELNSD
jgi:hypothetical protein